MISLTKVLLKNNSAIEGVLVASVGRKADLDYIHTITGQFEHSEICGGCKLFARARTSAKN